MTNFMKNLSKTLKFMVGLAFIFFISFGISYAQSFLTPIGTITGNVVATTNDGEEIRGTIRLAVFGTRGLSSFHIRDRNNQTHKFKANDISKLVIKVDELAKLDLIGEKISTLGKIFTENFDEVVERELITYEKIELPNKKGKYVLAQLLNPGFDSKIKIFHNPQGKSGTTSIGGISVFGDKAKSYHKAGEKREEEE